MFDFVGNIFTDFHPIIVHFPIALLVVSFGLSITARFNPTWLQAAWITFVIGALATIPATISGIISHVPYEETALTDYTCHCLYPNPVCWYVDLSGL